MLLNVKGIRYQPFFEELNVENVHNAYICLVNNQSRV